MILLKLLKIFHKFFMIPKSNRSLYLYFVFGIVFILGLPNGSFFLNSFSKVKASEIIKLSKKELNNKDIYPDYLLGPKDILRIEFLGLTEFSDTYTINLEGYLSLPELDRVYVEGLTISELEKILLEKYQDYLMDPKLFISQVSYRPVNIYITGEVKTPGYYNLSANEEEGKSIKKLFDAIQIADGITNYANLSKISVIRNNSNSQGGGKIKTELSLLSLLNEGDQSQNIRLYDGDTIIVKRSSQIMKDQIFNAYKSNLSPNEILIYITGAVKDKGPIKMPVGSSLTQAIAFSGANKYLTGKIEFLRFENDGTVKKELITYNNKSPINSKNNPLLMDGDIINVRKNILSFPSTVFNEITKPVLTYYTFTNLFD